MRRLLSRFTLVAAVSLAVAGCEEITEFPDDGVTVRAAHALPPVRTLTVDFTANVAVDNFSPRVVFVDQDCGWVIERLVGGEWVSAYSAPCVPSLGEIAVAPRSTHVFGVAALATNKVEPTDPPEGTYRVRVAIEAEYSRLRRQEIPEEQRTSNQFVVPLDGVAVSLDR